MFVKRVDRLFFNNKFILVFSSLVFSFLIFAALVLPISLRPSTSLLKIGDVAFQDIRSPKNFSFASQTLTEQARQEAEDAVMPVYLPADQSISKKQVSKLENILEFLNIVRDDPFSDQQQKIRDITGIEDVNISDEMADIILQISDEDWESIQIESKYLLEQLMKSSIREDQVASVQRNISPQISFEFDDLETDLISILVSQLIAANSLFSSENTNQAIETVRNKVEPVIRSYASGELIVATGEVIKPLQWEALQELGYTEPKNHLIDYLSAGFLVVSFTGFNYLYIRRIRRTTGRVISGLPILELIFLVFLFTAQLTLPNHVILPYMFPIAAFGMMVSSLFSYGIGLIFSISLAVFSAYNHPNMSDLALYYFLTSGIAILVLGRGRRTTTFFLAGLALSVSGSLIIISTRLTNSFLDFSGASTLIVAAIINGFASVSLALILQYLVAQILGKTTAMQLMDLSRPDHPLLQELLLRAPGTYQHCLQVANLAEQAAREINSDALLTRVGALYHDIGKAKNPAFFIENQLPSNVDTHEDMDPVIASATIIQHVEDGIEMAKKHRLPPQIIAFVSEHHGSMITRFQYEQALSKKNIGKDEVKNLDPELFTYPGFSPRSNETALVMMADGCEARVRAESPETIERVKEIVGETIENYQKEGQLDFTQLTQDDIRKIKKSYSRTLQNTYHHRIKYPENSQNAEINN